MVVMLIIVIVIIIIWISEWFSLCTIYFKTINITISLFFLVTTFSTTPKKCTPTKTTQPVVPHQDSNGTLMFPDMVTTLINTATADLSYT